MASVSGRGALVGFVSVGAALALMVVTLAVYFYRESARGMREAAQRVSFVNQVSHELKTPLTNLRLYAELLASRLPAGDGTSHEYVEVLVSESRRLSRLIGNVLTFAKEQRNGIDLHMRPGVIDDAVSCVLDHFRPSLESAGVAVEFYAGAGQRVCFDSDALDQILGNLFGNVEKYAVGGGRMNVVTRHVGGETWITVADSGPGIPQDQRERVFAPFVRLSDRPSDGVAGTGIGLGIARGLARLHGGDLTLEASERGAVFKAVLRTPPA
jgi:signal transduction histidine kinase